MNKPGAFKLSVAVVLLIMGVVQLVKFVTSQRAPEGLAYFYDLSERKLFVAPRTAVQPIRGLNNDEPDGVRAVVVSTSGDSRDKPARKIAYVEKYSPELKQQFEQRRDGGAARTTASISRGQAHAHIFVRRVNESKRHPANSPEAEKIMTEWQAPGPEGKTPVVCVP